MSFNLQTNLTTFEIWARWLGLQEVLLVQTSASARKNVRVRWLSHWSLTLISANPKCEKRCSRTTKEVEQACSVAALLPGIQIWSDRETRETLPLPCQLILKIWKSRHKWQVQRRVRVAIIRTSFSWLKMLKRVTSLHRWRSVLIEVKSTWFCSLLKRSRNKKQRNAGLHRLRKIPHSFRARDSYQIFRHQVSTVRECLNSSILK